MSFPLLSTLADLDRSLQVAEEQLERLGAGLDVNEQQLSRAIIGACDHAASLTDLIHAERPSAQWQDRASLEALILELKAAEDARRNQQRRSRLLELASELDAGRVQHRFESRTNVLNTLRSQAADELRTRAALPEQDEELPGPSIAAWLPWAFDLQDDTDAEVLAHLRSHYAALERFTAEMEEGYWVAAPRPDRGSEGPPRTAVDTRPAGKVAAPPVASPSANQRARTEIAKQNTAATTPSDGYTKIPAAAYERPKGAAASDDLRAPAAATATAEPKRVDRNNGAKAGATAPEVPAAVSKPDRVAATVAPAVAAAMKSEEHEAAPVAEVATDAQVASSDETQGPQEQEPSSLASHLAGFRKRPVLAWAGVTSVVVLLSGLFFFVIYRLHAHPGVKPEPTVEAATSAAAAGSPALDVAASGDASPPRSASPSAPPPASPAAATPQGPLLHRQPAEGAQDSILLSLEGCGRGKPEGIECWGYVSNLGSAASRVSLDRVDVVDGHGNSFSLERNGQFVFPTGQSSSVAAGSRVRYFVKVPDKDIDARTLTLYMDLSNPRSLEYTFRDVPVAQ